MRESVYQRRIKREYEQGGAIVVKMDPGPSIPKGFPDLLVLLSDGRVRLIEMKAKDGKVGPAQKYWHDRFRAMGHDVLVVKAKE
jgi:VRR-NUC domain.